MGSAQKKLYFKVVDQLRRQHPLLLLLHHAGVSKSGYYKWKKRREGGEGEGEEAHIAKHLKAIHALRPFYGYRRMTVALCREGFRVSYKRIYGLMRKLGIRAVIRKRRRFFGRAGSIVFPNLLGRNFKSSAPGRKLATDITYLPTADGFVFLSAVQDMHNNEILSHHFSFHNNLLLVLGTLEKLPPLPGALLHSDQGYQYTHKLYQERLSRLQLVGSHSRKGNCLDNASMESFFSHLKTEAFVGKALLSREETMALVEKYIRFYNTERFQKRLGQLSPVSYRQSQLA